MLEPAPLIRNRVRARLGVGWLRGARGPAFLALGAAALLVLSLPLSLPAASRPAPKYVRIPATMLAKSASLGWSDRQFVQADRLGRVYLLRARTLEIFAVTASGALKPSGQLSWATRTGEAAPIEEAALSGGGDVWVLFSKPNHLEVFQSGRRRESADSPWLVAGVAAPAGDPIVSVLPGVMDSALATGTRLAAPPSLARWDGKRWTPFVAGGFGGRTRTQAGSAGSRPGVGFLEQMRAEFSRLLTGLPDGSLWVADRYAYRVRRISPLGAVRSELVLGEGKIAWEKRSADEWKHLEKLARQGGLAVDRGSLSGVRAAEAIRALTVGWDGALYLVVTLPGGEIALDRFDPGPSRLERVLLSGVYRIPGTLTLAAGSDGLYLAGPSGRLGLWRIDRQTIEDAAWKPVPEATLDGRALAEPVATRP